MEILETLKKFTFSELLLNRLHGKTMINNERTIQSVLAAGMSKEGVAKDYYYKDSRFIDAFHYGMTKSSYLSNQNLKLKIENNISQEDVLSTVNSVFDNNSLDLESSMENTIEWDSMNHMFVMQALKEKLNVELSPNQIMKATSIKKILEILNKKI